MVQTGGVAYEELNKINVATFVQKTAPKLVMERCIFGRQGCKNDWKRVGNLHGQCIQTDPNQYPKYDSDNRLEISISINRSDMTGGWGGNDTGVTAYYVNRESLDDLADKNTFIITSHATANVRFQLVKRTSLGSDCSNQNQRFL